MGVATSNDPGNPLFNSGQNLPARMTVEDLVASFLSPSEQVKVVLETLVSHEPNSATPESAEPIDPRYSVQDTRILAVVSHIDEWNLSEEGWYV